MKCPCEECITLAVCKYKYYHGDTGILKICDEISAYLYIDKNEEVHKKRVKTLYKVMKPVNWELGELVKNGVGYTIITRGNK
jgi:hypothetical protein